MSEAELHILKGRNRLAKVENYRGSVAIKLEQVKALEESVDVGTNLFQGARAEVEYMDVLFAQRDILEARTVLIETKQQQLSVLVNAYQALGGGYLLSDSKGASTQNSTGGWTSTQRKELARHPLGHSHTI